jgi:hypothetical protein
MTVAFIRTLSPPRRLSMPRQTASDGVLIRRIPGGGQLAMQTLFVPIELRYTAGCCVS